MNLKRQILRYWLAMNATALDAAIHALVLFCGVAGAHEATQLVPALNLQQLAWVFLIAFGRAMLAYAAAHPVAAALATVGRVPPPGVPDVGRVPPPGVPDVGRVPSPGVPAVGRVPSAKPRFGPGVPVSAIPPCADSRPTDEGTPCADSRPTTGADLSATGCTL